MTRTRRSTRWRGLALLLSAGVLAGAALSLTPASAGKSASKKFVKRFAYSKDRADARFLDTAEGDGRYIGELNYIRSEEVSVDPSQVGYAQASCAPGWFATGGGGFADAAIHADGTQLASFPSHRGSALAEGTTAWSYEYFNHGASETTIFAYVVCARVPSVISTYTPGTLLD